MAELHTTETGRKFFGKDIPAMLTQLKRIADAMEKDNALTEKRLKMEHVTFVKEQRTTKGTTDLKNFNRDGKEKDSN